MKRTEILGILAYVNKFKWENKVTRAELSPWHDVSNKLRFPEVVTM